MCTEEQNEESYEEGHKRAYRSMLRSCCRELGYDDPEASKAAWIVEKEEIKATLREVCADFGDTDYSDDLHISDVIEKHLHRHLVARHNSSCSEIFPGTMDQLDGIGIKRKGGKDEQAN